MAKDQAARDLAGETGILDAETIAGAFSSFPLPTKLPMTVERYASLVARSESATDSELVVLHREYGVSDAAHRVLPAIVRDRWFRLAVVVARRWRSRSGWLAWGAV